MTNKPRSLPVNPAGIPPELQNQTRWVGWKYHQIGKRLAKVPLDPRTLQHASVTNPATWGTYEHALAAHQHGSVDGIGLTLGDDLVAVDLDNCVDPITGELNPTAQAIISQLHTYTEYSPSGTGLHLLALGAKPDGACKFPGGIEIYSTARYITITGQHLPGTPPTPQHRSKAIAALHAQQTLHNTPDHGSFEPPSLHITPTQDDHELLERMLRSRAGARIRTLFEGDTSAHNHDPSRADLALVAHFGFWTDYDRERMDRLFRMSALYRPEKWDRRHAADGRTYGQLTIDKACQNQARRRGK